MRQLKITKSITNRDTPSLEKYLIEIAKVDLITAEEEVELARRIREGDTKALEKLTKANLRFVVSVAKQYQNQGFSLPDLINEGNLGLIKAAQKFDETKGFKFISYAVWWIRQSILQALAEKSRIVRLPLNKVSTISRIGKAFSELEQEFEREPTVAEIAQLLEISVQEIENTMSFSSKTVSVDTPIGEEDSSTLLDLLENQNTDHTDHQVEHIESLSIELSRSLATLPEKHRDILVLYYGIGRESSMSLDDIARLHKLTRERVRQIRDKAILKLRSQPKNNILRKYLGK